MPISCCVVDTNILLRITRRMDPQHSVVARAVTMLAGQGTTLCYTHQNISELWNVMTRPVASNGFGLTVAEADREVRTIEAGMTLLADSALVYEHWRRLVVQYGISGVRVHDARLAAAMYVHGVPHILTFNVTDFTRFAGLIPLDPSTL